jgi:hypothetical protein
LPPDPAADTLTDPDRHALGPYPHQTTHAFWKG